MQKYRADVSTVQPDGGVVWSANWLGGPSVARINNCRLDNMAGDMRATVYVLGEADTAFSIPAACKLKGARVVGYLTGDDDGNLVFRQTYYKKA